MARNNLKKAKVGGREIKEFTPADSLKMAKALIKKKRSMHKYDLKPGHLIFTSYNAKDKTQTYDRTPLVLILRRNKTHTLGLNFHWLPFSMRVNLVKHIISKNAGNIRQRKPLKFSYAELKPMLKSLGYAPCIRLYINKRFGSEGVIVPSRQLMEMARLKTETFTKGKYSASQLYAMARKSGKARADTQKGRRNRR